MKKIILFCAFLLFRTEMVAQYQFFQEKTNLVLFSGIVDRQNFDQVGAYYGLYSDLTVYKTKNHQWLFGGFAQVSGGQNKSPSYSDYEYGGGLFLGNYNPKFSSNFQSFSGFSLGLTQQKDRQENYTGPNLFSSWQKDLFLKSELNLNFLKKEENDKWFPRTQIQLRYKKSLNSERVSLWNDEVIETSAWNKDYFEFIFKESIFKDKLKNLVYWSPKLVSFYSHSWGDSRSFYGLGLETSLFKKYRDDFLSLGVLFKGSNRFSDNYLIVSLNLNISSLITKRGSSKFKINN